MRIALDLVAIGINWYSINFLDEPERTLFENYCSSNTLIHTFRKGQLFQYAVNFLDFEPRSKECEHFLDALLMVFRKLGGILLKKIENEKPTLKIVSKYSINEKYSKKKFTPLYPKGQFNIKTFYFFVSSNSKICILRI